MEKEEKTNGGIYIKFEGLKRSDIEGLLMYLTEFTEDLRDQYSLTECYLEDLIGSEDDPIADAHMAGFQDGVGYSMLYLESICNDEAEAGESYKEAYLKRLRGLYGKERKSK